MVQELQEVLALDLGDSKLALARVDRPSHRAESRSPHLALRLVRLAPAGQAPSTLASRHRRP